MVKCVHPILIALRSHDLREGDADNYTYEAQCEETGSTGDITEDEDGRGIYLYLNGHGFLIPDAERNTFTIQFVAADFQMPDGNYETTYSRA